MCDGYHTALGGQHRRRRAASFRISMNYRTLLPFALVLAVVAFAQSAAAQNNTGFSVDRFEPSERGSEWFVLDTLDLRGHVRPALGIVADYAYKPLVFYDKDGNEVHA